MSLDIDAVLSSLKQSLPEAGIEMRRNPGPSGQDSLLVSAADLVAVSRLLRDEHEFDLLSNVTGVDWPDPALADEVAVADAEAEPVEPAAEAAAPQGEANAEPTGFLEVVHHLYSTGRRIGPLVLRCRTQNRADDCQVPSLVPVYRSAEFQEREVYDLFGVHFTGHPDLRRILMWDEFEDHPMRKDYVAPDDYEYEPTPHDAVLEKAKLHYPSES